MRILSATDQWYPDVTGGAARVATQTAKELSQRGHELTVFAPRAPGQPDEVREAGLTVLRVLNRHGLPQTLMDPIETRRVARRLRCTRFDVALAHQTTLAAGVRWSGIQAPLALVSYASAVHETRFLRSRTSSIPNRFRLQALDVPLKLLERQAIRHAKGVLVLSEFSRKIVVDDYPAAADRILRVSGGVDTTLFSPGDGMQGARTRLGLSLDVPLLFTARRLEPRMGLEELLRAFALLDDEVRLVIAGRGSLATALHQLSADIGVRSRVRFVGRVPDSELVDWYRSADLFVLPTVAYEGFGMATLEALSSGTPAIGTPVGATPELLLPLDSRLLAEAANAAALGEAIRRVLPIARGDLGERARRYVSESFAWDRVAAGWEEALERVRASPPPRPGSRD